MKMDCAILPSPSISLGDNDTMHIMKELIGGSKFYGMPWLAGVFALMLSACSDREQQSIFQPTSQDTAMWEIAAPEFLRERALNQAQVNPRVTLNGATLNLTPQANGFIYQGFAQVPQGEDVVLRVEWIEFFRSRELLLAIADMTYPEVSRDTAVILFDDDYAVGDNDGDLERYPRLDDDNDNVPNLAERLENSDPLLSTDPGLFRADAFIAGIDPARAPVIDGSYDLVWGEAQYQDRDGNNLQIDNRMLGFDPDRPEGSTEFRWGALHDSQFLYLFVLGESVENRTSQGDSTLPWHDDAIDIFWDGNRSQGSTYDGVDDYHLTLPLMKLGLGTRNRSRLEDGSLDPDGRAETGINSVPIVGLDGVEFAMCICPSQDTYEIRLDLTKLQIPIGQSFGFDVQINNDIDGQNREFKFGWRAPSAQPAEFSSDLTWQDPSRMGLIELVPNPPPIN